MRNLFFFITLLVLCGCKYAKKNHERVNPEFKKNIEVFTKDAKIPYSIKSDSVKPRMTFLDNISYLFANERPVPDSIKKICFYHEVNYLNQFDFFIDDLQRIMSSVFFVKYKIHGANCVYNMFMIVNVEEGKVIERLQSIDECDTDSDTDTTIVLNYKVSDLRLEIELQHYKNGEFLYSTIQYYMLTTNGFSLINKF